MADPLKIQEELACDVCGQFGAIEIGAGSYCADCHATIGSSCAGSRADDPA